MIINNKESKEQLKKEICKATINTTECLAFVAMQETNSITHREFKNLNTMCDVLSSLWDYADSCIDNDVILEISNYTYYIIKSLSELQVGDYKTYYIDYGEFYHYYE